MRFIIQMKNAQLINKAFVLDNSEMIYRKTVVDIILLQLLIRHNTKWNGTIVISVKHNTTVNNKQSDESINSHRFRTNITSRRSFHKE